MTRGAQSSLTSSMYRVLPAAEEVCRCKQRTRLVRMGRTGAVSKRMKSHDVQGAGGPLSCMQPKEPATRVAAIAAQNLLAGRQADQILSAGTVSGTQQASQRRVSTSTPSFKLQAAESGDSARQASPFWIGRTVLRKCLHILVVFKCDSRRTDPERKPAPC